MAGLFMTDDGSLSWSFDEESGEVVDRESHRRHVAGRFAQALGIVGAVPEGERMTGKRMAGTVVAAFVVDQVLQGLLHGFVLAKDYAPYYGTLLRGQNASGWQLLSVPVAHLSFTIAFVWVYSRMQLRSGVLQQGLTLGILAWLMGQVPMWLLWCAEQPWPDSIVPKQLGLELVASLIFGLIIAGLGARPRVIVASFAAAALLVPAATSAQTILGETFEVSSVKVNTQIDGPRGIIVDQGRFTATGQLLADLVRYAYGFSSLTSQAQLIGGPAWMTTTRFDIVATTKGLPSLTMLKALLQDRFKIVAHVESREMPVYALVVDRADKRLGPSIHVSTSDCVGPGGTAPPESVVFNKLCAVRGRPGSYTGEGASVAQLARALGGFPAVGRPVVDRTALDGVFDWTLQWTPSFNTASAGDAAAVANPDASASVSLFTALREQLGVKLDALRLPIDVLVIDRAELPAPD
jgi:uncharacterized protein (TIGR03435 family)